MGLLAVALAAELRHSEILVPPLVYGGALSGLLLLGNRLRFCDVDATTLTIDPDRARKSIGKRTRAILAVDMFGVPSDSMRLREIADQYGLLLISDCAQSFGAQRGGHPSGYQSDAMVVSFTSGKPLFAGEGGAVMTDDVELYGKLLWHSQHPHRQRRELGLSVYNESNLNGRINPLSAICADLNFTEALEQLLIWQSKCFSVIECLKEEKMAEPLSYNESAIVPSFFRLTVSLRRGFEPQDLKETLVHRGFQVDVRPFAVRPIYRDPAFHFQFARRISGTRSCPVADAQSQSRVSIHFEG
jgi:dTDP-4-amino-4,6-dideoxygalactose transaminase